MRYALRARSLRQRTLMLSSSAGHLGMEATKRSIRSYPPTIFVGNSCTHIYIYTHIFLYNIIGLCVLNILMLAIFVGNEHPQLQACYGVKIFQDSTLQATAYLRIQIQNMLVYTSYQLHLVTIQLLQNLHTWGVLIITNSWKISRRSWRGASGRFNNFEGRRIRCCGS